jgi:HEAT repeat protein
VGPVADLVVKFAPRFRPATDLAGAEEWQAVLGEFSTAVTQLDGVEEEIAEGLRGLLTDRDGIRIILWVHAAITRPTRGLVAPLCEVLSVRNAYLQHEWVAELLGEIGDPRAIPALRAACSFEVARDAFRSLPKRCLEALVAIGTPEAVTAAREQLMSPWPEVREWAAELLVEHDDPDQV